jgi:hypothetical protein
MNILICRKFSIEKLIQFSQRSNVPGVQLLIYIFFGEIQVFLQLSWIVLLGANRAYVHLETQSCSKYSFQKLTQFSQENNALDATSYYTNGFLSRDICVTSTHQIGIFWTKWALLYLLNSDLEEVFFAKTKSILTGKECSRCSCF